MGLCSTPSGKGFLNKKERERVQHKKTDAQRQQKVRPTFQFFFSFSFLFNVYVWDETRRVLRRRNSSPLVFSFDFLKKKTYFLWFFVKKVKTKISRSTKPDRLVSLFYFFIFPPEETFFVCFSFCRAKTRLKK